MDKSLYGNFRTRKLTDVYPNVDAFIQAYQNNGIKPIISEESATTLYYLLYARYGNSHIASSDENQFVYKLFTIIYAYGPSWEKRQDIQSKLRALTDDELMMGSKNILNHAYNPSTEPSTGTLQELQAINEQNVMNYKKSKLDGYSLLWSLITTDVTEDFLNKFKRLFLVVVEPEEPLWYIYDKEDK